MFVSSFVVAETVAVDSVQPVTTSLLTTSSGEVDSANGSDDVLSDNASLLKAELRERVEATATKVEATATKVDSRLRQEVDDGLNKVEAKIQEKKELRAKNGSRNISLPKEPRSPRQLQAGLMNAISKIDNPRARESLEKNMDKFMNKYQNRLQKMSNVTVEVANEDGSAIIRAKEESKFLGLFKVQKTRRFEVSADGEVKEKGSFFGFLFSKSKASVETTE